MSVGDKIKTRRDESQHLRTAINQARDEGELAPLIARRTQLDDEIDELVWEALTSEEAPHSDPVVVDSGVSAFVVRLLDQVKTEVERELARDDLYPNIRDQLFKRRRALEDVARLFYGDRRENKLADDATTELLVAEFNDDSVDYAEAENENEANEIAESMLEMGGVVARYTVIPYGGSDVLVHAPLSPMDNYYQELPAAILNRVLHGSRGRVKLPQDFVAPTLPSEVLEYLRLPEDE